MGNKDKIEEIAARLAKLSETEQTAELARIDRNVTKSETKAQKSALESHKVEIASHMVETLKVYAREKNVSMDVLLPLNITIAKSEDGKGIEGTVKGKGTRGGGGNGTRGPSFLKAANVAAIKGPNGDPLAKVTESEVLRVAHNAKTGRDVYGTASPHLVASKPENQKLIREQGFVAVLEDGSEVSLVSLYK